MKCNALALYNELVSADLTFSRIEIRDDRVILIYDHSSCEFDDEKLDTLCTRFGRSFEATSTSVTPDDLDKYSISLKGFDEMQKKRIFENGELIVFEPVS